MGITDLNVIMTLPGVVVHTGKKFELVVIDGSNLISVLLTGKQKQFKGETDVEYICRALVSDAFKSSKTKISNYFKTYGCKEIVITFDTSKALDYRIEKKWIYDNGNVVRNQKYEYCECQFKEEERKSRRIAKSKNEGKSFAEIESNIFALAPLVANLIADWYKYDNSIHIIETLDEADFVIKNLITDFSSIYDEILLVSEDSDYLVLLCDNPSVYKIGIRRPVGVIQQMYGDTLQVFNISQLWINFLNTSSYEELCYLAMFAGCDYTSFPSSKIKKTKKTTKKVKKEGEEEEIPKKTVLSVKSKGEDPAINYRLLFHQPELLSNRKRLGFIKNNYMPANPKSFKTRTEFFRKIVERIEPELIQRYVDIINLYESWRYVNRFMYFVPKIGEVIQRLRVKFELPTLSFDEYNEDEELRRLEEAEEKEVVEMMNLDTIDYNPQEISTHEVVKEKDDKSKRSSSYYSGSFLDYSDD